MTQLAALSEGTFVALLEEAPDAMVCIGADGRIVLVNAEAERLFGYQRTELIGQPVEILVPDAARAVHPGHRAGYIASPRHRPMGAGMPLAGRRRDASTFPAEISLSAIDSGEGILVACLRRVMNDLRHVNTVPGHQRGEHALVQRHQPRRWHGARDGAPGELVPETRSGARTR